jgi:hypothetical protein
MAMDVLDIRIDNISIPTRLRPLDAKEVGRLAASISEIGLKQPISVRLVSSGVTEDGEVVENRPMLVAGRHRLEALRSLGISHAPCIEVRDDDLLAELWEIDENLIRVELSPAQKAQHLARRKELWEAINEGGKSVSTLGGEQRVGFAADTANAVGLTKQAVNQHLARAEALGSDIGRVHGTSLDKGVELDALAKLTEPERADLIDRAQSGEQVSARTLSDYALIESRAEQREWSALTSAWNRARVGTRKRFLEETRGSTEPVE